MIIVAGRKIDTRQFCGGRKSGPLQNFFASRLEFVGIDLEDEDSHRFRQPPQEPHMSPMRQPASRYVLVIVILVAMIPGIVSVMLASPGISSGDGPGYNRLAINLLVHHVYSASSQAPYEPTMYRTPGYPVFLAVIYAVAGYSLLAVRCVQLLLLWLSAWLIGWIASRFFGRSTALISSCLTLIYLPLVAFVPLYLTEIVSSFLLILGLLIYLQGDDEKAWISGLAGLVFALLVLVRPSYLLFPFFLVAVLLWDRRHNPRLVIRRAGFLLIGFLVPISIWAARNTYIAQQPVGISTEAGINLYQSALQYAGIFSYRKTGADWVRLGETYSDLAKSIRLKARADRPSDAPEEVRLAIALDADFKEMAVKTFREYGIPHPSQNLMKRMAYLWGMGGDSDGRLRLIELVEEYLFMALVVIGIWLLRSKRNALIFFLLPGIYVTLLHCVFQVESRYSLQARCLLLPIAAYALGAVIHSSLCCFGQIQTPEDTASSAG